MIFFAYSLFSLLFLAAFFLIFSYLLSYVRLLKGEAPFVPVPRAVIPKIIEALGVKEDSVVFDLGCGDGRVLFAAHKLQPKATYIGIEKNIPVYLCAWIKAKKIENPHRVKIRKKDFFSEDISGATHVFTYLMPKMMRNLMPKFQKELAPGTRLVSCSFPLEDREPTSVIDLKTGKIFSPLKLYIYDF